MVQNLTWSVVYPRSNLLSNILQKVLKLVLPTATVPKVYVSTITTVLFHYYYYLVETLNHMKSLKLKDHLGENVAGCCDAILVDSERLDSSGVFKPKHLGCIIRIFEDTYDSIFHTWETQKYKEFIECIKNFCVWRRCHATWWYHYLWFPCSRSYVWIPQYCWLKALGTYL